MRTRSISVLACAVGLGALAMSALSRGGPLQPPPEGIAPTGVTLQEINNSVNQLASVAASEPSLALSVLPTEFLGVIRFTAPPGEAPITGDEIIGPFVDAIGVHTVSGPNRSSAGGSLGDIVVVKEMDKATPKLQEAICNGTNFPTVEIEFFRTDAAGGREAYFKYEMTDVIITSVSFSSAGSSSGDTVPTESVSFNYSQIKIEYKPSMESHTTNQDGTCAAAGP